MPQVAVRYSEQELKAAQTYADANGITRSEALRRGNFTNELPPVPWKWTRVDFEAFSCGNDGWPGLTLLEGSPFTLEGHLKLILDETFGEKLVELLVLLPKGNRKTATLAALAVFHLLTVRNARCYIGAADKVQAQEMYDFASYFAEPPEPDEDAPEVEKSAHELLTTSLLVRRSTREIRSRRDQGFIRVLASDDSRQGGKRQGFNPTLALIDEGHAHENPNLYLDMRTGVFKRRAVDPSQGKLLQITTAGWDHESMLGQLRLRMFAVEESGGTIQARLTADKHGRVRSAQKDGRLMIARSASGRNVMLEWANTPDDDLEDPKTVKLANPSVSVTLDSIEDAIEAPGISIWTRHRYRSNVWTLGFESWLPQGAWEKLAEPTLTIPEGAGVYAAVDMARYKDCAAVVMVQPRGEYPAAVKLMGLWKGSRDNPPPYAEVRKVILAIDERYRLLACGYDRKFFDESASILKDEGLPMLLFEQGNDRMCPAATNLRTAILSGGLRHDGDPTLQAHVVAGTVRDVGANEWRLEKSSKPGAPPVDALIALAMAHQLAFFDKKPPQPVFEALEIP